MKLENFVNNPYFLPVLFFILPCVIMLITGRLTIARLKQIKGMKWSPREDTPDSHIQKAGTPSMGGIAIIGAAILGWMLTVICGEFLHPTTNAGLFGIALFWGIPFVFVLFVAEHAILGFVDDWSKATGRGGLRSRSKLVGQTIFAIGFLAVIGVLTLFGLDAMGGGLQLIHPLWVIPFALLLIIGTSNAVNLADGIDGLAAGLSVQCSMAFGCLRMR